jgi:hypothetical protein
VLDRLRVIIPILLAVLLFLVGCGQPWQVAIVEPAGGAFSVDREIIKNLASFTEEGQNLTLERVLWTAGHRVVQRLLASEPDGTRHEFDWASAAGDAWWGEDGCLSIGGEVLTATHLEVVPPPMLEQVEASITDIAPTASAALGLPSPAHATGKTLDVPRASHVLLLFLDGFGYLRYAEARDSGLIPNLVALGEPLVGLTVYPPSTSVATAALLTGAPPERNGVDRRGIRKTEAATIFDEASEAGLDVVAIEGEALAFNLRNAEMQLSGDRDGNGSTDDNVLANALRVLDAGPPDLLFVHFHGIDDAGHSYGPGAEEEEAVIRAQDAAVGQLLVAMPPDTLIVVFADHGMHHVHEGERLGNHGHLIERDMLIPIWVLSQ